MRLTLKTPGGQRTITLPVWLENRIWSLFIRSVREVPIGSAQPAQEKTEAGK